MDEITAAIEHGIVLKLKHATYYGADAIRMLTLLGTCAVRFNRLSVDIRPPLCCTGISVAAHGADIT
jgi:hypothetical protein